MPPSQESPPDAAGLPPWKAWTAGFLLLPLLALVLVHMAGLDEPLALRVFDPASPLADAIRDYSPGLTWALALALACACLWVCVLPGGRRHRGPVLALGLKWGLLALLSLVVLSEGLGKQYFDRARPRETIALGGTMPHQPLLTAGQAFNGQSQVSSHVVSALLVAGLYFFLFPRRRRLARAVLVAGLSFAALVGYGRMVSGAHFLSDVLVSFLLTMAAAMVIVGVASSPRRGLRVAAVAAALLLVGGAYADFTLREARRWRALDEAMAGEGASSLWENRRQHAALRRQGWLLRIEGSGGAVADAPVAGVAGLREALARVPAGAAFRLALVDTTPFDAPGFGGIRLACDQARIEPLARHAAQDEDVRVYRGVAGQRGDCPGLPFAFLDAPRPFAVVAGDLDIRGWAVDPASRIVSVELLLDGRPAGAVGARLQPIAPGAGMGALPVPLDEIALLEATRPFAGLPAGWHAISLRATNAAGTTTTTPPTRVRIVEPGAGAGAN